jgi:magnesium transporter
VTLQYQPGLRALLCSEDGSLQETLDPDSIDRFIAVKQNLLWLDVDTSVTRDLSVLQREFGFHTLTLEDAIRPHQRAKIEPYNGYTFLVFYTVTMPEQARRTFRVRAHRHAQQRHQHTGPTDAAPNLIALHQIAMFVGSNYLVTVHHGALKELEEVSRRWHTNIHQIDRSIGALVYSLLDTIVDDYFPIIDRVADLVEDVEQSVFEDFDEAALEEIFTLKKALLSMRRVVAPERDVLNVLIRRDSPIFGEASLFYFQDVYDHVVRVSDSLDIYRDLLSSALDAYLSMASNRLNEVMKTLTSWTIPLMAGALIAGIYGMNFEFMPELDWRLGYPAALGAIAVTIGLIVLYFRRRHWL